MIHTNLTSTAIRSTRCTKIRRPTAHKYTLSSLTCTGKTSKIKFFFVIITFFTSVCAAWLLHPSQVEKQSCDLDNYSSTKPTIIPIHLPLASALTMAPSTTTEIKNTSSVDSFASKHRLSQLKKRLSTSTLSKVPGANIIAATVTPGSTSNPKLVDLAVEDEDASVSISNSLIRMDEDE